nr:hypothetical protein KitaXyl93_23410 [Kitasatospora sp. Xyl93]
MAGTKENGDSTDTTVSGGRTNAETIQAARQEVLAQQGLEQADPYACARVLFYPPSQRGSGRVGEITSLGPRTSDTYIAELIEKVNGQSRNTYTVVIDGKINPNRTWTLDVPVLLYLGLKYNDRDGSTAARILGMPDADQPPAL